MGYILPEQGVFQAVQTLLKAGVQVAMSGVMNGWDTWDATIPGSEKIGGIFGAVGDNFVGKSFATLGQQLVTNTANGFIDANSLEIEDGKVVGWRVDTDQWTESVVGKNAIAGYVGSFVQAGTMELFKGLMPEIEIEHEEIKDHDLTKSLHSTVERFAGTLSGIAGEAAGALFDGEFTLNLLNLSDFAQLLGANDPSRFDMGLFEIGFSANGVKSRIGSGGASIDLVNTVSAIGAAFQINEINHNYREMQEENARIVEEILKAEALKPKVSMENDLIGHSGETMEDLLEEPELLPTMPRYSRRELQEMAEREALKADIQGILDSNTNSNAERNLVQIFSDEGSSNAMQDVVDDMQTVDKLRKYLEANEVDVTEAEKFMRLNVLEEGLVAFDFTSVALSRIETEDLDLIADLKQDVLDVLTLKDLFNEARDMAMLLSKKSFIKKISEGDSTFNNYNSLIGYLQQRNVINDHMIFNPFDQDFISNQEYFNMASDRILVDENLAHSRMLLIDEKDSEFIYIVDTSEAIGKHTNEDGDEVDTYQVYKLHESLGPRWKRDAQERLVWTFDETILENENKVDSSLHYYSVMYEEKNIFTGEVTQITFKDARMAAYKYEEVKPVQQAIIEYVMGHRPTYDKEDGWDRFTWDFEHFTRNVVGYITDERLRDMYSELHKMQESEKWDDYIMLKNNGYDLLDAKTFCNFAVAEAIQYYPGWTSEIRTELRDSLSRNYFTHEDTLNSSEHFTKVSLEYAGLWGKTSWFAIGRSFGKDGKPGHISRFADMQLKEGSEEEYNYWFDNSGEWTEREISLQKTWGWYTDLSGFSKNVDFFVYTPSEGGIR